MQRTRNAFAALALDEGDAEAGGGVDGGGGDTLTKPRPATPPPDENEWLPAGAPRPRPKSGGSGGGDNEAAPATPAALPALKRPLVWLDLEMTGLNPDTDTILEIALAATDGDLTRIVDGPDIVVAASEATLSNMNEWCVREHGASGLTAACRASSTTLEAAEDAALAFVAGVVPAGERGTLAGSSVHVDYAFLRRHMPRLAAALSHRLVDVSSVGELARRWHPAVFYARPAPPKDGARHRAAADVRASIAELRHYKKFMVRGVREAARDVARGCPDRGGRR
jgi:oligoribonuclease